MASNASLGRRKSRSRLVIGNPSDFRRVETNFPTPAMPRPAFRPLELSIYDPGNELPDILALFESDSPIRAPSPVHHQESHHHRSESALSHTGSIHTIHRKPIAPRPTSMASSRYSNAGTFQNRVSVLRSSLPPPARPAPLLALPKTSQDFDDLLEEDESPPIPLRMAPTAAGLRIVPRSPQLPTSHHELEPDSPHLDIGRTLATDSLVATWPVPIQAPRSARSYTTTTVATSTSTATAASTPSTLRSSRSRASSLASTVFSLYTTAPASTTTTPLVGCGVPEPRLRKSPGSLVARLRRSFSLEHVSAADPAVPLSTLVGPIAEYSATEYDNADTSCRLFGADGTDGEIGLAMSKQQGLPTTREVWERRELMEKRETRSRASSVVSDCPSLESSWSSVLAENEVVVGMAF